MTWLSSHMWSRVRGLETEVSAFENVYSMKFSLTDLFSKQMWKRQQISTLLLNNPITPKQLLPWLPQQPHSARRHQKQDRVWSDPSQKTSVIVVATQQTLTRWDLSARDDHNRIARDWTFTLKDGKWHNRNYGKPLVSVLMGKYF